MDELKSDFHQAVDDYLKMSIKEKKQPETAFKGSFNVRIDPALHRNIAIKAKEAGMSLNAFVKQALARSVL